MVAREFPAHTETASKIQAWKTSRDGWHSFERELTQHRRRLLHDLRHLNESLFAFAQAARESSRALIDTGATPLPADDAGRIARLLERYLQVFGVPQGRGP